MDLKALNHNFKLEAVNVGTVDRFPNETEPQRVTGQRSKYRVSVKNLDTGKRTSFSFYGSIADFEAGKIALEGQDLIFALYCFLSDGLSGQESFSDFCGNFGYDEDSRTAERIHKECVKSLDKLGRIGLTASNLSDLLNHLQEKHGC